jgi:hypothetical protein
MMGHRQVEQAALFYEFLLEPQPQRQAVPTAWAEMSVDFICASLSDTGNEVNGKSALFHLAKSAGRQSDRTRVTKGGKFTSLGHIVSC